MVVEEKMATREIESGYKEGERGYKRESGYKKLQDKREMV